MRDFYANEEDFESLIEKVDDWSESSRITLTNTQKLSSYTPPLGEAQASEIQAQLQGLGIKELYVSHNEKDGMFSVKMLAAETTDSTLGRWLSTEGSAAKGYMYIVTPPKIFQERAVDRNLRNVDFSKRSFYSRPIKGNWYLYVEVPESS